MVESKTAIEAQPIYDAARQCIRLFEKYPQEPKDHLREPISVSQKRFRTWAAYLGVFALKSASLDMRLRFEPEIRDLTMLLLDVLQTDLRRVIKLASKESLSRQNTLYESSIVAGPTEGAPLPLSNEAKGALSGIVGSIDRLHRLAVRIRTSSRDDQKLEDRVVDFAKQLLPDGFKDLVWTILKYKFPNAEEGLITKLTKSIVFRRHRLLYQRHHYKKLSYVRRRSTAEGDQRPGSMPTATRKEPEHQQQCWSKEGPVNEKKARNNSPERTADAPKTELVSNTNPTFFWRDRFDQQEDDKDERKAPTVFSVGSSWVGKIDYPLPPSPEGDSDYAICQFCFQELKVVDNEDPKWWATHVDKDMDHYICLSDECHRSLYYFDSFKSWLRHMDSEHETDWPQFIYPRNVEWRCTLSEDHGDLFSDVASLEEHLMTCHPGDFDPADLQLITDNSSFPQPREPDLCPLCHNSINNLKPAVQEEKPAPKKGRKAVVKFEDQVASSGEERDDTRKKSQPPGRLISSDNSSLRMAKHIAKHLKSVSFLSLRCLESDDPWPENADEVGAKEEKDDYLVLAHQSVARETLGREFSVGGSIATEYSGADIIFTEGQNPDAYYGLDEYEFYEDRQSEWGLVGGIFLQHEDWRPSMRNFYLQREEFTLELDHFYRSLYQLQASVDDEAETRGIQDLFATATVEESPETPEYGKQGDHERSRFIFGNSFNDLPETHKFEPLLDDGDDGEIAPAVESGNLRHYPMPPDGIQIKQEAPATAEEPGRIREELPAAARESSDHSDPRRLVHPSVMAIINDVVDAEYINILAATVTRDVASDAGVSKSTKQRAEEKRHTQRLGAPGERH